MLYVLLYFVPETLKQETAFMREVSDKYFCDNWVVSTYMGHTVWLPEAWEGYRAAKAAITNTTATADIKRIASGQGNKLRSLVPSLRELLTEGSITQVTNKNNSRLKTKEAAPRVHPYLCQRPQMCFELLNLQLPL